MNLKTEKKILSEKVQMPKSKYSMIHVYKMTLNRSVVGWGQGVGELPAIDIENSSGNEK